MALYSSQLIPNHKQNYAELFARCLQRCFQTSKAMFFNVNANKNQYELNFRIIAIFV